MDLRMPMEDRTERLDGGDGTGDDVVAVEDGAVHLEHGLPREPAEVAQQRSQRTRANP